MRFEIPGSLSLFFCSLLALALMSCVGGPAYAEDSGITVSGTGEVKAKPNVVEIDLQSAGTAELTGDAIVKFRDAKRRTIEAFAKLNMKNLQVQEQGISLSNPMGANPQQMFVGNPGQAPGAKPQVEISRAIRLVLGDIQSMPEEELMETIGKLLDTAKDSGATVGASGASALLARMYGQQISTSMATFVLDNVSELRDQANQKAMEQARSRAERLAALAGVKLGPVIFVQEVGTPGSSESSPQQMWMAIYGIRDTSGKDELRVTSDKFAEIPVRVSLQVRFSIAQKE